MEAKLAEFRARKRREETRLSVRLRNAVDYVRNLFQRSSPSAQTTLNAKTATVQSAPVQNHDENLVLEEEEEPDIPENPRLRRVFLLLKLILWLATWGIFIELQFGIVYFVCSMFVFLYLGTRTSKKRTEPSAYSVFNRNCERIQGTFTAEQFESHLLHRLPPVEETR